MAHDTRSALQAAARFHEAGLLRDPVTTTRSKALFETYRIEMLDCQEPGAWARSRFRLYR